MGQRQSSTHARSGSPDEGEDADPLRHDYVDPSGSSSSAAAAVPPVKEEPRLPRNTRSNATTTLSADAWCSVIAFLPWRVVARVRAVSRTCAELAQCETHWALRCAAAGIVGDVSAEHDPAEEPQLYRITTRGAPCNAGTTLMPWQQAVMMWSHVGCCEHLTEPVVEALVRNYLVPRAQRLHHERVALSATCEYAKCTCKPQFCCVGCGLRLCSRGGASHMAAHAESGARGEACVLGMDCVTPPSSGYCYKCNQSVQLAKADRIARIFPLRLAQLFATRSLNTALTHAGLFMRHECPHLDDAIIDHFSRRVNGRGRQRVVDTNCEWPLHRPPGAPRGELTKYNPKDGPRKLVSNLNCVSRDTYVCVTCQAVLCGINADGHMHDHCRRRRHLVVLCVRSLDTYCFGCDRFLGFGGSPADAARTERLRNAMRLPHSLFHHREGVLVWDHVETSLVARGIA